MAGLDNGAVVLRRLGEALHDRFLGLVAGEGLHFPGIFLGDIHDEGGAEVVLVNAEAEVVKEVGGPPRFAGPGVGVHVAFGQFGIEASAVDDG